MAFQLPSSFQLAAQPTTDNLQACRLLICGKVTTTWYVFENKEMIGTITREDSKWVHDNWKHSIVAGHRNKDNEKRLSELRTLVWRAFKKRQSDNVQHTAI